MIRSYSELIKLETFQERFDYLILRSEIGVATFGFDRYLNQKFYTSTQWRQLRHQIIVRDNGCDLGLSGYEIFHRAIIHHMNPMTVDAIVYGEEDILDPEYLITTTHKTHNAIHFGNENLLPKLSVDRASGDTKLW
jgi:hypothetical protein